MGIDFKISLNSIIFSGDPEKELSMVSAYVSLCLRSECSYLLDLILILSLVFKTSTLYMIMLLGKANFAPAKYSVFVLASSSKCVFYIIF